MAIGYTTGDERKLDIDGGTMTGPLILADDPTADLEAATKQYVDDAVAGTSGDMLAANNLSDLASPATARTNLGLGAAATLAVGSSSGTVAAGDDSRFAAAALKSANLSDLADASTARTNLGLGAAATLTVGTSTGTLAAGDDSRITGAAQKTANLSDLASAATARTNLGLGASATMAVGTASGTVAAGDDSRITGAAQKASNLSDLASASTSRTNLGLGGAAVLAVGTTAGTVAAGDHTHTPSTLTLATMTPADHGLITWSIDPALAGTGNTLSAAGVMHLIKVKIAAAATVSYITLFLTAAASGGTPANMFAALYDSAGTRRAVTADLTAAWTGSTGYLEHAVTTPYAASAGTYYVALLCGTATTQPSFSRNAQTLAANAGLSAGTYRFSTYGSGQSSAPSSITLASQVASSSAHAASFFVGLKA